MKVLIYVTEPVAWTEEMLASYERISSDGRRRKAEKLKNSKAHIETVFYEWLLSELPGEEKEAFCKTLDTLYWKSKWQRQKGFTDVAKLLEEEEKR